MAATPHYELGEEVGALRGRLQVLYAANPKVERVHFGVEQSRLLLWLFKLIGFSIVLLMAGLHEVLLVEDDPILVVELLVGLVIREAINFD